MSEEKRIMDFLGIGNLDGNVHGQHLGKILSYLKMVKKENLRVTLSKLSLTCSMGQRYVKESYMEGLANWGIIRLYQDGNSLFWVWVGEEAFNGKVSLADSPAPISKETVKVKESETDIEPKKGYCPVCGKKLKKNKKFCNEKCMREYLKKKKEKK